MEKTSVEQTLTQEIAVLETEAAALSEREAASRRELETATGAILDGTPGASQDAAAAREALAAIGAKLSQVQGSIGAKSAELNGIEAARREDGKWAALKANVEAHGAQRAAIQRRFEALGVEVEAARRELREAGAQLIGIEEKLQLQIIELRPKSAHSATGGDPQRADETAFIRRAQARGVGDMQLIESLVRRHLYTNARHVAFHIALQSAKNEFVKSVFKLYESGMKRD